MEDCILSVPVPAGASGSAMKDVTNLIAGLEPFVEEEEPEPSAEERKRMFQKQQEISRQIKAEKRLLNRDLAAELRERLKKAKEDLARRQERRALELQAEQKLLDFDPKQGGAYYSRLNLVYDIANFDHDEESPLGSMRFTDVDMGDIKLCAALNILSVKIASLDVDFPILVYGKVIARDSLDQRCVYLFKRDKDDSQLINSKDETLILTGPKRGLALISSTYIEIDLKIRGHQGQVDRELSKGVLEIQGMARRVLKKCELESRSLATRLSTVAVIYSVVKSAVEATIFSITVLEVEFNGAIYAFTSSMRNGILLHDSKLLHHVRIKNNGRLIELVRNVVTVYLKEKLILAFLSGSCDCQHDDGITQVILTPTRRGWLELTPKLNGRDKMIVTLGVTKIRVEVAWSIIYY
ncbi:hypothetical protein EJB05_49137 [Eragrostis curvula]|uniref:DUF6598 domain-containing protein n=1 Tax=Eragrostis curvula TaxID=38414 RepID=A0A5J9T634_9POAL|nr:hypothetical protein EJB05_49137 [Eragrostis curvula]